MKIRVRLSIAVLLIGALCVVLGGSPPATAVSAPVRILTLGDSITAAGQWQTETARLLTASGVPSTTVNVAVSGTKCSYWPERINDLLTTYQPDLVVLACGTNDDPQDRMPWGESRTGWSLRMVVEAVYAYRPAARARTLPVLVQYSDPLIAPAWLLNNEPQTNDSLWTNEALYINGPQLAGIANLQTIPATADYLLDDGIHPTNRGYRTIGRMVYDSAQSVMGWPATAEEPLCGLYGHRLGLARPTYIQCSASVS